MINPKKTLDDLQPSEILKLSGITLEHMILMIRHVSFLLLSKHNHNKERQEFYINLLIEMSDIIHNIPNYMKHNNQEGLLSELQCTLQFFENKVCKHSFLIQELDATKLIHIFAEKGVIMTKK